MQEDGCCVINLQGKESLCLPLFYASEMGVWKSQNWTKKKKKKNKTDKKINKGKIKKPYRERYQRTFKIHKLIVGPLFLSVVDV